MVFKRVLSPLATFCFLWTTNRFNISTTVTDGNWEPGRPLWYWIKFRQEFFDDNAIQRNAAGRAASVK